MHLTDRWEKICPEEEFRRYIFFPRGASEKRVWEANCNNGLCNIYREGGLKKWGLLRVISLSAPPPPAKKGKLSSDPPPDHFENVIKTLFTFTCSLRSKSFRLVSEQRKTSFGRPRNETRAKKWKRGEREGKEGNFLPHPSPLFYLHHFSRNLWLSFLVLCS